MKNSGVIHIDVECGASEAPGCAITFDGAGRLAQITVLS
jgi:hypothetical protein